MSASPATLSVDTPKERSLKARDAILAAALRVFASDGYHGASMPKIAREAKVAAPLIHYYFESKENLWRETIAYSLGDLRRDALAIGDATRSLPPLDRLRVFLQSVTRHAARWPDNFVMIIAEARSDSDRFTWAQEHYAGVVFQELRSILEDARKRNEIKDINIDQLASLLIGGMLVYFTANSEITDNLKPEDLDRISSEYATFMFDVLLDGITIRN